MKAKKWFLRFATLLLLIALIAIGCFVYSGDYRWAGTEMTIDVNSGQLRTARYLLLVPYDVKFMDTPVSRIVRVRRLAAKPNWQAVGSTTIFNNVFRNIPLGYAPAQADMIGHMVDDFHLSAAEQQVLADSYLSYIQKRDCDSLQKFLQQKYSEYEHQAPRQNPSGQP